MPLNIKHLAFIIVMSIQAMSTTIAGQGFGPQSTNDTIRFQQLKDYVSRNYFSRTENVQLYAEQAISLAIRLKDKQSLAELYRMMGIIQYFNGEYDLALNSYQDAVKIFTALKDPAGEAAVYNEIGNVYRKYNRLDEALDILKKAYDISFSLKDSSGMAKAYNNTGIVYEVRNELGTALAHYKKSLDLYEGLNDSIGQSYCYENIGGIYLMMKDFGNAEIFFTNSLRIRQEQKLAQATAISFHYLGELYNKKGDLAKSNAMFDSCVAIGRKIDYPDIVQRAYFSLAGNYKQGRNFAKAYDYFERASVLKDSLFNVEKSRQFAEMETKYRVENTTRENLLLKKSNELSLQEVKNKNLLIFLVSFVFIAIAVTSLLVYKRRQNLMAIQTQLRIQKAEQQQRIRISHDLHDHVGAQLSYVVSNLDIASQEILKSQLEPKRLNSITEMSKQAISTLRETVWALNNESISIESFADKFKSYARKMSDLTDGVSITFHEDITINNILLPNTALHLFRICQEAFSNALKHAECSTISIHISSNEDELFIFSLKDNGKGFDPEKARLKGHYGLENMKHRASEVGASYTIDTQIHKGTNIKLALIKNTTYE
jgi:signal transduction histidine kinase/Tfp pilus assembly protein PilF